MPGTQYSLMTYNQSPNLFDFCVFQEPPDVGQATVLSLAWFSKTVHPTTSTKFKWTIDYTFSWSETGELKPGVEFSSAQNWPADPSNTQKNKVKFTYLGKAFTFEDTPTGGDAGRLYIEESSTIPRNRASIGIGMSGNPTCAVQAQPNLKVAFTPKPKYYIAAGNYQEGEVIDVSQVTDKAEIPYGVNVFNMTAVLNEQNQWQVQESSQVDHAALKTEQASRRALWFPSRAS